MDLSAAPGNSISLTTTSAIATRKSSKVDNAFSVTPCRIGVIYG
jgi:hypothetical protein